MKNRGKLFIVSAPSGAGKTSLIKEALKRLNKYKISKVITYTVRQPRTGEVNGIDYHFITKEDFTNKISENFFLESTDYIGKLYASPISTLDDLELGESKVLIVDRQGAKSLAKINKDSVYIWITPPNISDLKKRLLKRGTESSAQIEVRLKAAHEEMEEEVRHRIFQYHVINDVFEDSINSIISIIESVINPQ